MSELFIGFIFCRKGGKFDIGKPSGIETVSYATTMEDTTLASTLLPGSKNEGSAKDKQCNNGTKAVVQTR